MDPMSREDLRRVARLHQIRYRAISDPDPLMVRTSMARVFPIGQRAAFDSFADPVAHVGLFEIIKGSTKAIRKGVEPLLAKNEFFAFEHVQESSLPPRLMLLKYTLSPPHRISKVGVTDPFLATDVVVQDRKKATVHMDFKKVGSKKTEIKATSAFLATTGEVFSRGFIDRVWLNFFERMMVANGIIKRSQMQT